MQISELQLRQTVQHLLKEEVYGKIATVYHGSKQPPEEFIKLFENESGLVGWETGKGAGSAYGHGLYTVWTKTNHQTFKGGYGDWIYKFKVNLEGFIIFDDAVCKQVYGASLTPLQQLEKLGKKQLINSFDENIKKELSKPPVQNRRSADLAASTSKHLFGNVNGIVFWGSNDGPVVIAYDPNIVTPMSYAKLEDAKKNIWTKWNPNEIKKSLSRSAQAGTIADPERLQLPTSKIHSDFNKLINISDERLTKILEKTSTLDFNRTTLENITNKDFKRKILSFASNIERFKDLAASSKDTPPETLTKLAGDNSRAIRIHVLRNSSSPPDAFMKLAEDVEDDIRRAVAQSNLTPPEAFIKLAGDTDLRVRQNLTQNESTPIEAMRILVNDKVSNIRNFLAVYQHEPEILVKLAKDSNKIVRAAVARNRATPPKVLMNMTEDKVSEVRDGIVENTSTPEEVLMKLTNDKDRYIRVKIVKHKNVTPEILMKLTDDSWSTIRYSIAVEVEDLPLEILTKLVSDKDSDVRGIVARNKSLPEELIIKLSEDPIESVRKNVIWNKDTPTELIRKMTKDDNEEVKLAAQIKLKSLGLQESLLRRTIRRLL